MNSARGAVDAADVAGRPARLEESALAGDAAGPEAAGRRLIVRTSEGALCAGAETGGSCVSDRHDPGTRPVLMPSRHRAQPSASTASTTTRWPTRTVSSSDALPVWSLATHLPDLAAESGSGAAGAGAATGAAPPDPSLATRTAALGATKLRAAAAADVLLAGSKYDVGTTPRRPATLISVHPSLSCGRGRAVRSRHMLRWLHNEPHHARTHIAERGDDLAGAERQLVGRAADKVRNSAAAICIARARAS